MNRKMFDLSYPPTTWIAHALVTVGVGLVFAIIGGQGGMVLGSWMAVAYFALVREPSDKWFKVRDGTYDDVNDGVSGRADFYGDVLGPICVAVGASITALL